MAEGSKQCEANSFLIILQCLSYVREGAFVILGSKGTPLMNSAFQNTNVIQALQQHTLSKGPPR